MLSNESLFFFMREIEITKKLRYKFPWSEFYRILRMWEDDMNTYHIDLERNGSRVIGNYVDFIFRIFSAENVCIHLKDVLCPICGEILSYSTGRIHVPDDKYGRYCRSCQLFEDGLPFPKVTDPNSEWYEGDE